MRAVLENLGLTTTEAEIYLTLLRLGPSTAGIIARKAGIHRRSVYDATARLSEKGLVGYISKNNRKHFEAVDPSFLKKLLDEKEASLDTIMPQLQTKYKAVVAKQETLFFKGKNGLKTIFEDQLITDKEILVLGASPVAETMMKYYIHHFNKRREKQCLPMKLLYTEDNRKRRNLHNVTIKYLPKAFQNPAAMNIYGDKVAIIHWSKERPFAIVIHEKDIAEGYRNYFQLLWGMAKR